MTKDSYLVVIEGNAVKHNQIGAVEMKFRLDPDGDAGPLQPVLIEGVFTCPEPAVG